jgi:tetratricopeptide (TPR) repeat protein
MEDLAKVRVALRAPERYQPTEQDLAALKAQAPTTAAGFMERGGLYLGRGLDALAMADFDKAVALEPASSLVYASRAIGHATAGRLDAAKADIAKAQGLDPRSPFALHAAGQVAMREGRFADAAAAFGRASDLKADNTYAVRAQAGAYMAMGETDKALASLAELARIAPTTSDLPLLRSAIYVNAGQRDRGLAELDGAIAKAPNDARLHLSRGLLLSVSGRREDAEKAITRSIEITPTAEAYLGRAANRDKAEVDARLADIAAAEKLAPGLSDQPSFSARRAEVLADASRFDAALAVLQPRLKAHPDDSGLVFARADVYLRAGRQALAARDFAALRAKAGGQAEELNAICWQQAIRNFALETALADCDAALKASPTNANALDSRAFVLLRLGRLPEAVTAYDEAVKVRPRQAESLFGRALARLGLEQTAQAEADLTAARGADLRRLWPGPAHRAGRQAHDAGLSGRRGRPASALRCWPALRR